MSPHRVLELIVAHLDAGGTLDDFETQPYGSEGVLIAEHVGAVHILRQVRTRIARDRELRPMQQARHGDA